MGRLSELYPVAIVTGASSGLGRAFTQMLLDAGVHVIGVSRRPDVFPEVRNYEPVVCDLTDLDAVKLVISKIVLDYPQVQLVINNAGYGVLEELSELSAADIQRQYAVMLTAPALIASGAVRHFQQRGMGCLVNVSSLAVELPLPLMSIYNSSKAGLSALSKSLMLDEISDRYQVIDFRPGDFNTEFATRMEGQLKWNGVDLRSVMDRHHAVAPKVDLAVVALRQALLKRASGIVRVGDFFQSKIAPLGVLLPWRCLLRIIRRYYQH